MRKIFTFLIGLTVAFVGQSGPPELGGVPSSRSSLFNSEEEEYPFPEVRTPNDMVKGKMTIITKEGKALRNTQEKKRFVATQATKAPTRENSQIFSLEIEVSEPGKLRELLGENLNTVEALKISGNINAQDFNTLWEAAFHGALTYLDMGLAYVEGGIIPDEALYHFEDQFIASSTSMLCLGIRQLILPSNVTTIGELAFAYLIELEELGLPDSLVTIGEGAFSDCYSLPNSALDLPDGLEFIDYQAFYDCFSLAGEIVFPKSLRYLLGGSFYMCGLTKVTFPSTLEGMGLFEFYGCCLSEVDIPDNCFLDPRGRQFYGNEELVRAHLPDHSYNIPQRIFVGCPILQEVNIPNDVQYIYAEAFQNSSLISEAVFPEGLLKIGESAFLCCNLSHLNFPSTLVELGAAAFGLCPEVNRISCRAIIPPVCNIGCYMYPDYCPFGDYIGHARGIKRDIPVYVPIGTKELYEQTPGWDYFTNFIETDFSTGIDEVTDKDQQTKSASPIYDIQGKPVKEPVPGHIYIRGGKKELIAK